MINLQKLKEIREMEVGNKEEWRKSENENYKENMSTQVV